jgi:hypothetical protein
MGSIGKNWRRVTLLGAFEIQPEGEGPVRDGLIIGSRRMQKGFVLETSRESIEQIVALANPRAGTPKRLLTSVGETLRGLGATIERIELKPLPLPPGQEEDGYGAFVQGFMVYRDPRNPNALLRLAVTATEAIQLAIVEDLYLYADLSLLSLSVSSFLAEIDAFSEQTTREATQFRSFVDKVTATDFQRFYEKYKQQEPGEDG